MYRPINVQQIKPQPIRNLLISEFRGVDYRQGEYSVNSNRAPYAVNTMCGENPGGLRARPKTTNVLAERLAVGTEFPTVYGIHIYEPLSEILVHIKDSIYLVAKTGDNYAEDFLNGDCALTVKKTGVTKTHSMSFMFEGKLYIIGCGKYLVYDGATIEAVENNSNTFIPTTSISNPPSGGGVAFEAVNLLNKWRKNSFYAKYKPVLITDTFTGNGTNTEFTLSELDSEAFTNDIWTVKVDGTEIFAVTEDRVLGKVTFTSPPNNGAEITVSYYVLDIDDTPLNWENVYQLDTKGLDNDTVTVVANGVTITEASREDRGIAFSGNGETLIFSSDELKESSDDEWIVKIGGAETEDYTRDIENGTITFDEAPAAGSSNIEVEEQVPAIIVDRITGTVTFAFFSTPTNPVEGVDNVIITFAKTVAGYTDQINKCSIYGSFGGKNDTRIFLSGNSDTPNKDWHSGLLDATYFPDTGYDYVGLDNVKIMGYAKQFDTQMVIKESSQEDATAYLRTFALDGNNNVAFPREQGIVGTGAISSRSFAYLDGSPLFVSPRGVETIQGTNVDNHRNIVNVSELINSKLTQANLSNCVCVSMGTNYYIFTDAGVFVCDSRMMYRDNMGNPQYEWMFWDGNIWDATVIPSSTASIRTTSAVSVYKLNGIEYLLGGVGGMLYRFKKIEEGYAYTSASWETPRLTLGAISQKKRVREIEVLFNTTYEKKVTMWVYIPSKTIVIGEMTKPNGVSSIRVRLMFDRIENIKIGISATAESTLDVAAIQVSYQLMNN